MMVRFAPSRAGILVVRQCLVDREGELALRLLTTKPSSFNNA